MTNRRGLSRALAVTSILTAVAAAVPATASAATASPVRPAGQVVHSRDTGASLNPRADWAAVARQAATAGRLTLPSMLLTAGATGAGTQRTPAFSAIIGVVRGADGAALTGACVTASGPGGTVSVRTGPNGRYVLAGLRPGAYTVSYQDCDRPGRYFEQWSGGADLAADAASVLVRASRPARLAPVTLRLTSPAAASRALAGRSRPATAGGATISGIVRSRSGRRLGNICAMASTSTRDGDEGLGTSTGPKGGYNLPIGSSGKWLMSFTAGCGPHQNYAPQWWRYTASPRRATLLHARRGGRFRGIDAVLRPGASISGVVRARHSGQPLANVCVVAAGLGPMGQVQVESASRANGSYLIKDLGTGRYQVYFDTSCELKGNYLSNTYRRAVSVIDGKTTTGIDGYLSPGGAISGVVTSHATGARVAGICVELTSASGNSVYFGEGSAKSGRYSWSHLTPGRYLESFFGGCGNKGSYAPQSYDGQANALGATPIIVSPGQARTGIGAEMLPGATVTGRAAGRAGRGVPGVCVALVSKYVVGGVGPSLLPGLSLDFSESPLTVTATGRGGRYRLTNLMPGQYAAEFIAGCGHGSVRYGSQVFAPHGHGGQSWIWAGGGTVTRAVNVVLRPAGSIMGVITGRHGRRLSGICPVALDPATQGPLEITPIYPAPSRRGVYRIRSLAAGRYAVGFASCWGPSVTVQWYRRRSIRSAATLVPVRTGRATTGINAAMISGGTLTGRVVSAQTGRGAAEVCVVVTGRTGGDILAVGTTGPSGRYQVRHVPPGRWNLWVVGCLGTSRLAGIVYPGVRARNGVTRKVATIRLPQPGGLAGTVTGGTPATAQPGICVEATPVAGDGQPGTAVTGRGGRYTLTGLAPGQYRVLFTPDCVLGTAALVPALSRPVTVRAGVITAGIGAQLAADGGIAGTVSTGGRAAVGVCAAAFAQGRAAPTALAITRAGGRYELDGLAPGRYQVEFTAGCGDSRYPAQWFRGAKTRSGATTVTVTAGSVTTGITEP